MTPGWGWVRAQLNTVRTDSTPLLAIVAHWASCVAAEASVVARSYMTAKKPWGTLRRAACAGAATASRANSAASRMSGRCMRGMEPGSLEIDALLGLGCGGDGAESQEPQEAHT